VTNIHDRRRKSMSQYVEPTPAGTTSGRYEPASAWVGWIAFAGVIMTMLGTFHIIQGLVALFNDEYFLVGESGLVVNMDFTAWGWAHVIGGVIVLVAGFCVFAGQIWARAVGTVIALGSAVVNLAFLGAYPFWSLIMIGLAVAVILALTVHGSDIKP
jgi:hypothetical protein